MATTNTNPAEEIVEKRATAPIATACLIVAALALLGSIVLQVAEVSAYRSGGAIPTTVSLGVAQDRVKGEIAKFKQAVEATIAKPGGSTDASGSESEESPSANETTEPEGSEAKAVTPAAETPASEEPASEEPASEEPAAEPASEEPAAEEPAAKPAADPAEEPAAEPAGEEPASEEPAPAEEKEES